MFCIVSLSIQIQPKGSYNLGCQAAAQSLLHLKFVKIPKPYSSYLSSPEAAASFFPCNKGDISLEEASFKNRRKNDTLAIRDATPFSYFDEKKNLRYIQILHNLFSFNPSCGWCAALTLAKLNKVEHDKI